MKKYLINISASLLISSMLHLPAIGSDFTLVTFADGRAGGGIRQSADDLDSLGNIFVFDQKLLASDANTVIGRNAGYCIRTDPGAPDFSSTDHQDLPDDPDNNYGQCSWTLTFNKKSGYLGSLTVSGREADLGASNVAIVGGTGFFVGATGMLTTTPVTQPNNGVLFRQDLTIKNIEKDKDD